MKRLVIGCLASIFILSGFSSCEQVPLLPDGGENICAKNNLQTTATLCPDRTSLGFATEFFSGTIIGTRPLDTIAIRNGGLTNLEVTAIDKAGEFGNAGFKYSLAYDLPDGGMAGDLPDGGTTAVLPASIRGNKHMYLQVIFAPTQPRAYSGSLTVTSNAANAPVQVFTLTGCGVPADGGSTPCYRDGGTGP
jgi:hypothetical protein